MQQAFTKSASADVALTALLGVAGVSVSAFATSSVRTANQAGVDLLFNRFIPIAAVSATAVALLCLLRHCARAAQHKLLDPCAPALPRFGRKGLLISGCSLLFALSCAYRSIFVADEGAALCRGAPSAFNAPVSGRAVATVGEIALVVQISAYIVDTAKRLGVTGALWSARNRFSLVPVCAAECCSWCGVLSGNSRFFCAEYCLWCLLALAWSWDAAELLHLSKRRGDVVMHSGLLLGALGLLLFNLVHEIPHFFVAKIADDLAPSSSSALGVWECVEDAGSPLWLKRLPFFFIYFFGCSWLSTFVAARYLTRGAAQE